MTASQDSKLPVVFFGTHNFAVTILQGLIDDPRIEVVLVITQPDKPIGRKKELHAPATKLLAQKYNIPVEQPTSLKNYKITNYKLQIGITAQYGLIIPQHILETPAHGILNVHTSLLPKYRGASPIQSVLINGETETGVTIMKMDVGMDTGPVLLQKTVRIAPDDTYNDLDTKLAQIGSEALLEAVFPYVSGELTPVEQDNALATTCSLLKREDGKIIWAKTSSDIYNQYRGMTPWPGIWTMLKDKRLKLLEIKPAEKKVSPGSIHVEDDTMFVGCGEGSIQVLHLQLEGKKAADAKTFLNGHKSISRATFK